MAYEPNVLGLPITYTVELFCFIHLIICLAILPQANGSSINIAGVLISPIAQWLMCAFLCISIVSIVCAGVGVLYHIETLLTGYILNLMLSVGVYIAWFVILIVMGSNCTTHHKMDGAAIYSCGFVSGGVIVIMTLLCLFMLFGSWLIFKARKVVRNKYSQELLPYLASALNGSLSTKDAGMAKAMPASMGSMNPASMGLATNLYGSTTMEPQSAALQPTPTSLTLQPSARSAPVVPASASYSASLAPVPVPSSMFLPDQVGSSNPLPSYSAGLGDSGTRMRPLTTIVSTPSLVR